MPFDKNTWILLVSSLFIVFMAVFIVNRLPKLIQTFIYGARVKMPGYSVNVIFFGMGQTQIPTKNFSRIIFILFTIFCLIFRTAYQGVLFELITTDVHKTSPTTILELLQQNYSFHRIFTERNALMEKHLELIINETKYLWVKWFNLLDLVQNLLKI